eukprot:8597636-Pyramimonas_sp.AAC.1
MADAMATSTGAITVDQHTVGSGVERQCVLSEPVGKGLLVTGLASMTGIVSSVTRTHGTGLCTTGNDSSMSDAHGRGSFRTEAGSCLTGAATA